MNRYRHYRSQSALRRRVARTLVTAGFLFLPAGMPPAVFGAPDDSADTTEQEEEQQENVQEPQTPAEETPASAEVFLPTEEISEDYPAPFPVDI